MSLPTKPRATTVITAAGGWLLALDLWNELEKSQRHLVFADRSEAKEVVMVMYFVYSVKSLKVGHYMQQIL